MSSFCHLQIYSCLHHHPFFLTSIQTHYLCSGFLPFHHPKDFCPSGISSIFCIFNLSLYIILFQSQQKFSLTLCFLLQLTFYNSLLLKCSKCSLHVFSPCPHLFFFNSSIHFIFFPININFFSRLLGTSTFPNP